MPEKRKYSDRAEYMKRAVARRREKLRAMVVQYKGDKCSICGYNECVQVFDLRHKDDSKKEFGLSARDLTRSWEKTKEEADRCILVCANCHREIHAKLSAASSSNRS